MNPAPNERPGGPRKRLLLFSGLCAAVLAIVAVQTHLDLRERSLDYRPGDPVIRLYTADLSGAGGDPGRLVEAITRSGADLVVLQNVGPAAFDVLETALPALRYRVSAPAASASGGGETLIASRYALLGREEEQSVSGSTLRTLARTPVGRIELVALAAAGKPSGSLRLDRTPGVAAVAVAWQPGVAAASLRGEDMRPVAGQSLAGLRLPGWSADGATAVWRSNELGVVEYRPGPAVGGRRPALITDLNLSRRR